MSLFSWRGDFGHWRDVIHRANAAGDVQEFIGGIAFNDETVGTVVEEFLQTRLVGVSGQKDDRNAWKIRVVAKEIQELKIGTIRRHGVEQDEARNGVMSAFGVNANTSEEQLGFLGASADVEIDPGLAGEGVSNPDDKVQVIDNR